MGVLVSEVWSSLSVSTTSSSRVGESQQTAAEPDQDPGHVAWLWPAAEACRHQQHLIVVDRHPGC